MKSRILHIICPTLNFDLINKNSVLLTSSHKLIEFDVYHTSLGEMPTSEIIKFSSEFSTINFVKEKFDTCTKNVGGVKQNKRKVLYYFLWIVTLRV